MHYVAKTRQMSGGAAWRQYNRTGEIINLAFFFKRPNAEDGNRN